MTTNLFSTYSQGENRVTATFLAVLQRLSLPNINRILGALLEQESSYSLVSFANQVLLKNKLKGEKAIPDARIGTSSDILVETKITRDEVTAEQIGKYVTGLEDGETLLVLTPDDEKPDVLNEFADNDDNDKVKWANFITLEGAIDAILKDEDYPTSEREAFLLREFVSMLHEEGLISNPGVLVIAGSRAWPEYERLGAYITHPRSFRHSSHLAFYAKGTIQPRVPEIMYTTDSLLLTEEGIASFIDGLDEKLKHMSKDRLDKIQQYQKDTGRYLNFTAKVLFLSAPDADETVKLDSPIANDKKNENGKLVPFTYGSPRYVTLESVKAARKTSELERP